MFHFPISQRDTCGTHRERILMQSALLLKSIRRAYGTIEKKARESARVGANNVIRAIPGFAGCSRPEVCRSTPGGAP
jgi:hypothetical protein